MIAAMPNPATPMYVELRTTDGRKVVRKMVPPFKPEPPVISWGTRVFTLLDFQEIEGRRVCVYQETFHYAIPSQTGLDEW